MTRKRISSGTECEQTVGYSRAVRTGDQIHVSGTTATDESGDLVGIDDPYRQTKQAITNIETVLREADSGLGDVIRTRLYVTDIEQWEAIGRAHGEAFGDIRPATSMIEIERLIEPEMIVEIEAVAQVA